MVYIAVRNVPSKISLPSFVKQLAKVVHGKFEALNFTPGGPGVKICYVKLADRSDARQFIQSINRCTRFNAVISKDVPNLPPAKRNKGKIPLKTRMALRIPTNETPDVVFVHTHIELLTEMQSKYTGLFNLSRKTGHKLLDEIARTLFERLKEVSDSNPEALGTGFKLSSAYRRLHPHFGDFTLILGTLHRLQDAAGAPRTQMVEADLISVPTQPYVIDNVPLDKVQAASAKYAEKITSKLTKYVQNLETDFESKNSDEDLARKRVREELKNLTPYLPTIVREVIKNHFIPRKAPFHKVRIYGEPFMPSKDLTSSLLKRLGAVSIMRSDRMYNLLRFCIPLNSYTAFMALDGTVVGGAKLVARSSDMPSYRVPRPLVGDMRAAFGVQHDDRHHFHAEGEDDEDEERD